MHAADTSWLYALFHPDDEHHARAIREAQEPTPILVNPIVLVEFLDLVRSKTDRATSVRVYRSLAGLGHVRILGAPRPDAMARLMESHGGLSWEDSSVVATALAEGAGLRTFDKDQRKAFDAMA